jgi:predicted GIY-YIG superfamily endonuclease
MPDPTALYRHFDANGQLLYIGVSLNPVQRMMQHSCGSDWFYDISRMTIEWIDSRYDALKAEHAAIIEEKPLHNKVHSTTWEPPKARFPLYPDIKMHLDYGDFHDKPHVVEYLEGQVMFEYISYSPEQRLSETFIDDADAEKWAADRGLKPIWTP